MFLNFFICVRDLEEIEWFEKKICGLLKKQSLQGMEKEETSLRNSQFNFEFIFSNFFTGGEEK